MREIKRPNTTTLEYRKHDDTGHAI
jgi:hypothetical protein